MEISYDKVKNDYKKSGVFYSLFLAPKIKCYLTIDKFGIVQDYKTFKGFNDTKRLLDRSQYFEMIESKTISALLPNSWKKTFDSGIFISTKMRFYIECHDKRLCIKCNIQVNENKEFRANLNLIKYKL